MENYSFEGMVSAYERLYREVAAKGKLKELGRDFLYKC